MVNQWLDIPPEILCARHAGGCYNEHHKLAGSIKRGRSIEGYITGGCVQPNRIFSRYTELCRDRANRRTTRGQPYKSKPLNLSPADLAYLGHTRYIQVDTSRNLQKLLDRCPKCRANYQRILTMTVKSNKLIYHHQH